MNHHVPTPPNAKALPHNLEAEQALLGIILWDNAAYERVGNLKPQAFYEPFHARLYAAIEANIRKGMVADAILMSSTFDQDEAFRELGGLRYLADLNDRAPPSVNAGDYAREIADLHRRRSAITLGGGLVEAGKATGPEALNTDDLIEQAESELFALGSGSQGQGGLVSLSEAVVGAIGIAAAAYQSDGGISGVATELDEIDRKVGGLHPSDLIVLAGRPSMGKSALATNIGLNVARAYRYEIQPDGCRKTLSGGRVAFFSLEMSAEQLALRMLAEISGVPSDRLRKGEVTADEFGAVRDAAIVLNDVPLFIDATGSITMAKLTARARRMKRQGGLDLVIVDYLQLVGSEGRSVPGQRVQEVSAVTMGLKALAKELGCPVIALSQLSRQVEQRDDKRPQLSDLRESGSIEQDADMVWFVYREAYYTERAEPREGTPEYMAWAEEMDAVRDKADVIIAKQRHGPIGTVHLAFNSALTKFGNLSRDQVRQSQPGPGRTL
jgi:replicative DNA helicase